VTPSTSRNLKSERCPFTRETPYQKNTVNLVEGIGSASTCMPRFYFRRLIVYAGLDS